MMAGMPSVTPVMYHGGAMMMAPPMMYSIPGTAPGAVPYYPMMYPMPMAPSAQQDLGNGANPAGLGGGMGPPGAGGMPGGGFPGMPGGPPPGAGQNPQVRMNL